PLDPLHAYTDRAAFPSRAFLLQKRWAGVRGLRSPEDQLESAPMTPARFHLRFWGVRGTVPTPFPDRLRYGGNTPCAAVDLGDNKFLVLDAGTGLRVMGHTLLQEGRRKGLRFDIFLSHYHFDHLEGLSLFPALYEAGCLIRVHGASALDRTVADVLRTLVAPPYFPVALMGAPAGVEFHTLNGQPVQVGGLTVATL